MAIGVASRRPPAEDYVESAVLADAALEAAAPGSPIHFVDEGWDAFAACCEVGAELLDESWPDGLTDAQYVAVLELLRSASSTAPQPPSGPDQQ